MKLISQDIFPLQGTKDRFLHLATAQEGFREYICMFDLLTNQCYVERFIGGQLEAITDDNEFQDASRFFLERQLLDIRRVLSYLNPIGERTG